MKYIDAEKLIAEIERQMNECIGRFGETHKLPEYRCLKNIHSYITSLQQEQPEPTCKSCDFYENDCPFTHDKFMPYPNKVCKYYIYSAMKEQEQPHFVDASKMEQPEVDLEKEVKRWKNKHGVVGMDDLWLNFASYFYELGLNTRKEN